MKSLKKKLFIAGFALAGLFVAIYAYNYNNKIAEQKMLSLLNGNPTEAIVSFETKYQQRRLICTDSEVLSYFKEIILKHPSEMTNVGGAMSYKGYFKFRSGNTFDCYMETGTNGFEISIPSLAAEESFPTHSVLLIEPVPQKVKQLFEFLNDSGQKADGTILTMEDGKTPFQKYDASLIAK